MGGDSWKETTIGAQATLQRGIDITKVDQRAGKVPVISSGGISSYHDTAAVKGPGVVLGRKGVVGSVFFVEEDYWPHDTSLWVKDFHGNYPRFVYYFFKSVAPQIARMDVGSANPTLNRNHVHPIAISWPPLREQKAIAAILGALDDKIELNRRMNATLEAMARALFQSWFVDFDPVRAKMEGRQPDGLDPAALVVFPAAFQDSLLGSIPLGWTVGTIQDCCTNIQNGGTPRRSEPRYWENGDIPWLTSGEVRQAIITTPANFITEAGQRESSAKWVSPLSTVVALYGATAGQVSLVSSRLTTNQAVCALVPKMHFAFFNYLWMRTATAELENKAVGSAQQNISKGIIEETKVILPQIPVLEKFSDFVSPIFELWIANLHQSRTLAALRDTLLPKLLSGEVRVGS